jgi:hypothetical protein
MTANIPRPLGRGIVLQALAEVEGISKTMKRISQELRAGRIDFIALREDIPAIRRACRNLATDVRGLGRLLEGPGRAGGGQENTIPTCEERDG